MLGVVLALTSSLCWGVSDFVGGVQARRRSLLRVMFISQAVGLVALGVVLIARGVPAPPLHRLLPALGGGIAGMAALTGFYRGLAIGSMSIVAPISSTGVAVPVIVGIAGGDHPAALQLVGIVAAVVGIVLASREHGPGTEAHPDARASVGLALVAALGFGLFFVGVRAGARADALWSTFSARSSSVLLLAVASAVALRAARSGDRRGRGGGWAPLALVGLLDAGANALFAVATRHGLLSVVSVLASLYPLATVLLARIVLQERVRRVQEVGVVTALSGVLLIAAAG